MRGFLRAMTGVAGALAFAGAASASVVYDNGGPNTVGGNEAVEWVQTEDFSFGADVTVNGAGVYLAGYGGITKWDGSFQYYVFGDSAGSPGTILQGGSVSPTVTDSGAAWCCVDDAYLFEFDFNSPFLAEAGSTYHLGIHAGASDNFNRDDIYWVTTANHGALRGRESEGGTFDNWSSNGQEHAYFLNGDQTGGAAPEPATWALMIGGFGLVGAALRRRAQLSLA